MVQLYEGPENTRAPGQKLHRGLWNSTAMSRVPLVEMESFDGSRDVEAALGGPVPAELPSPPRACLRGARPPSSSTPAPRHPCLPCGVLWLG